MRFLATVACGLASATVVSYAAGMPWLREWLNPPMAINTALAVLALGLAILVLTIRNGKD